MKSNKITTIKEYFREKKEIQKALDELKTMPQSHKRQTKLVKLYWRAKRCRQYEETYNDWINDQVEESENL